MFRRLQHRFAQPRALLGHAAQALRSRRLLSPVLALVICGLLLVVLQHLSQAVDYRSVIRELRSLSAREWIGALGATALSYVALVGRDAVGLRYLPAIQRPLLISMIPLCIIAFLMDYAAIIDAETSGAAGNSSPNSARRSCSVPSVFVATAGKPARNASISVSPITWARLIRAMPIATRIAVATMPVVASVPPAAIAARIAAIAVPKIPAHTPRTSIRERPGT